MTDVRKGELDLDHFRSERFVQINNLWYFMTRESSLEGPYRTEREARIGALQYCAEQNGESTVEHIAVSLPQLRVVN